MLGSRFISAFAAVALLFAGHATAAYVNRAALIATDPVSACNPPNNGNHHLGSSCKYYSGPSDSSPVVSGTCVNQGGKLTCVRG